jgi:Kdo2-lipid IVA lauroyltransferase/acyltransferase
MNLIGLFIFLVSLLPFPVLHFISDVTYVLVYYGVGYRKKTVRENLIRSFPDKNISEIIKIEKKFFQYFCDLMFETFKTSSMSRQEILDRCRFENPEILDRLYADGKSLVGISSHMGNWEWVSLSVSVMSKHKFLAVYKPLSNQKLNNIVLKSREKFGAFFVPIKRLRSVLSESQDRPYFVGLLSDQAPHDYAKALELPFLNQRTYFVPGPGLLSVKTNLTPVYGWVRRIGRSRYAFRLEVFNDPIPSLKELNAEEQEQVKKFATSHGLEEGESIKAYVITQKLARGLEEQIKMAPQDWLWSHRRWKSR